MSHRGSVEPLLLCLLGTGRRQLSPSSTPVPRYLLIVPNRHLSEPSNMWSMDSPLFSISMDEAVPRLLVSMRLAIEAGLFVSRSQEHTPLTLYIIVTSVSFSVYTPADAPYLKPWM